jgi:excisionase family DNA binding protein
MQDRWLSVDEIAEYLGISRDTVYTWLNTRDLPGHRIGRLWKFKRDEVDAWVRTGKAAKDHAAETDGE